MTDEASKRVLIHSLRQSYLTLAASAAILLLCAHCGALAIAADAPAKPATKKAEEAKKEAPAKAAAKKVAEVKDETPARKLRARLLARTDVAAEKTPLNELLKKLSEQHEVPIRIDEPSFEKASIALDSPVTISLKNVTLNNGLTRILRPLKLRYDVEEDGIVVTAAPAGRGGEAPRAARVEEEGAQVQVGAAVAEIAGAVFAPGAANVNAMEQQFLGQFRPILRVEINFVRKVCQPDAESLQKIEGEGDRSLKDAVKKYADMQNRMQRGQWRGNEAQPDPYKLIQEGLAASVKTHLSEEQWKRYQSELDSRAADRRKVCISNVIAKLDDELILSAEQRDKLSESLVANWNDSWAPSLETFLYGNDFFPNIPDKVISPHLTEPQKKIWREMPKNSGAVFFGGIGFMGMEIVDPGDEEAGAQPAAAGGAGGAAGPQPADKGDSP